MGADAEQVALDLVPSELIAPRLKRLAAGAVVIGALLGVLAALFGSPVVGAVVAAVVAVPVAGGALAGLRRGITLTGTTVHVVSGLRSRTLDVTDATGVDLVVRTMRIGEVSVEITDGRTTVSVPVALYAEGGGRELDVLALRRLADALAAGSLPSSAAIVSVLVEQLRAEARGAGLVQRPLYRAAELVKGRGRPGRSVLSDQEVADLVDD
ncbi:hypothetical protein [Rhodococcus sp. HNM0569]|uniref:hypothetical protein n=1 Tax=Rhodococcus sp. HNM0569 TaxID=2716340 RepID=UPI00146D5FDD|nr:hypothetical protein [Rhodococcus sp. HNM0569]NLU81284.1 hypothetical protein [Rhodococcus sp. HNM0569]